MHSQIVGGLTVDVTSFYVSNSEILICKFGCAYSKLPVFVFKKNDFACFTQFYRDTLETADDADEAPAKERSPPPLEKMDTTEREEMPLDDKTEDNSEPPTIYMETDPEAPAEMETGRYSVQYLGW